VVVMGFAYLTGQELADHRPRHIVFDEERRIAKTTQG
jgi:hypothetical protein